MSQLYPSATLASMPGPVLTVYLATNPLRHLNRNCDHGCSRWFGSHAKQLLTATDISEQDLLLRQIKRVKHFLKESLPESRGVALFAGPDAWHVIPLPSEPENDIAWGKPKLWQLIAIAQRHQPWCIATVDRSGARLFLFQYAELTPMATLEFHVDPTHWKRLQGFHSAERNVGMAHGAQRDLFERRYETQHARFLSEVAHRVLRTCESNGLNRILLLGPRRSIAAIEQKLPSSLRKQAVQIPHLWHGSDSMIALSHRVEEILQGFEGDRKARKIMELGERGRAIVTGAEETLSMLQRGRLSLLIAEETFNPILGYCSTCDHANATSTSNCPRCQRPVVQQSMHEILPQLLIRHGCESEFVSGKAADRLHKMGSMGGWLRQKQILTASRPFVERQATVPTVAAVA